MKETPKRKSSISAFGTAVTSKSVAIEVDAAELHRLFPDWSEAEAGDLLERHGPQIAAAALRAAWKEIVGLIEVEFREVRHER